MRLNLLQPASSVRPLWLGLLLMGAGTLLALSGCVEHRVTYDHWAEFGAKFGDGKNGPDNKGSAKRVKSEGWAILLERFEGNDRFRRANALIRRLVNNQQLTDLWIQEAGGGQINVYRGRYRSIADAKAQSDLEQVRTLQIDGLAPYEDVELVSLSGDGRGGQINPLDLRAFSGYYSLQIGFYDSDFGSTFREAAEDAAKALRAEGEQAYFYHGVHRSMVTVGLFTDDDFERDGPVHVYGPRILTLQDKYPDNLGNGRQVIQTYREGDKVEQRSQQSSLVRVP